MVVENIPKNPMQESKKMIDLFFKSTLVSDMESLFNFKIDSNLLHFGFFFKKYAKKNIIRINFCNHSVVYNYFL